MGMFVSLVIFLVINLHHCWEGMLLDNTYLHDENKVQNRYAWGFVTFLHRLPSIDSVLKTIKAVTRHLWKISFIGSLLGVNLEIITNGNGLSPARDPRFPQTWCVLLEIKIYLWLLQKVFSVLGIETPRNLCLYKFMNL